MSLATVSATRLAGCGNNQLWYEDLTVGNGTLVKLAASDGTIDTTDNLEMFEAFGKAVILNGVNKKIADFVNSKITTTNLGTNSPDFGTLLTGGSSGAKMTVDYITSLSGACTIYGYRLGTATFSAGETVTGLNNASLAVSFVTTVEVAPPHWYNFTSFGNSDTFGTLSDKLYLGCLYLGRVYMAGDPSNPYSWGASRQGNMWDYLYNADDVQSPVTGGDVEVGRLQDVIRALIPCGNDYLIFGCASGMYYMEGDPKQGGSLKRLDGAAGIFGSHSWCFDEGGNLYYFGTGGIYRVGRGLSGIEHLTEYRLPKIIVDEAADPTTHRVTICYDMKRHGLVISIVNLSTQVNSCYWYERRTDGFFPEQYPLSCAPFSMYYYNSSVPAQRDLLIGGSDGYIRQFDESTKDDTTTTTTAAVDSYVTFGPFALSERMGDEGIIGPVYGILAGGATGGSQSDSNDVTYYIYVGDSPEQVMEKVVAVTPSVTGTVYAPGMKRGGKQRRTARGKYAAIQLRNNTTAQTWGFEEIEVEIAPAGRLV